ncbi:MAG: polyprenyl synthetase family protein, partial [Planctomycetota bacterium]
DDLRRGRPTCHKKFDDATAVLAGDALLTLAFETLADRLPPDHAAACCRELAVGAGWAGMVGGQHDDLDAEGRFEPTGDDPTGNIASPTDPESIHARKTGALIVASLRIGAITGDASQAELARLAEYGRHLGLAFQIVDDLLDATGDAPTMGKAVGKDVDSGKATYPARFGIDESRRLAERAVAAARDSLSELSGPTGPLESVASFVLDRDH